MSWAALCMQDLFTAVILVKLSPHKCRWLIPSEHSYQAVLYWETKLCCHIHYGSTPFSLTSNLEYSEFLLETDPLPNIIMVQIK